MRPDHAKRWKRKKREPFSGSDFDMFLELDNFFAFHCEEEVRFFHALQSEDKKSELEHSAVTSKQNDALRKYLVSAEYRKIYIKDIVASSRELADKNLKDPSFQKDPEFFSGWKLVKDYECFVAEPIANEE